MQDFWKVFEDTVVPKCPEVQKEKEVVLAAFRSKGALTEFRLEHPCTLHVWLRTRMHVSEGTALGLFGSFDPPIRSLDPVFYRDGPEERVCKHHRTEELTWRGDHFIVKTHCEWIEPAPGFGATADPEALARMDQERGEVVASGEASPDDGTDERVPLVQTDHAQSG